MCKLEVAVSIVFQASFSSLVVLSASSSELADSAALLHVLSLQKTCTKP